MRQLKDLKKSNSKALVIAAHPDDETLFAGGTIAEFKKWRWTIFCVADCDEMHNRIRRGELLKVCRIYNKNGSRVTAFMLGAIKRKRQYSKKEIEAKIEDFIRKFGPFDSVFTHGKNGDYGHRTHKLIHNAVKILKLHNVYNFSSPHLKYAQEVRLSPRSRRTKRKAMNIYLKGSQKTNLSRLKNVVTQAINASSEYFLWGN